MEKLKILLKQWGLSPALHSEQDLLNQVREYLQVIVLKLIYQSKFGAALSFMGGTCLRICYDLKRYSEDLDFCLDDKKKIYSFPGLIQTLKRELELLGFKLSTSLAAEEKTVQKAFLSFSGLSKDLGIKSYRQEQKLHIKLEVDTHALALKKGERESFFVNRFDEIYPILKHTLPTLFAGKMLALFCRPYQRGRDYYDLIWYLSHPVKLNLAYLNRGMKGKQFKDETQVFTSLYAEKIKKLKPDFIVKDMSPFLEDPGELNWISRYEELFRQLTGV